MLQPQYTIHHKDRNCHGGGVFIVVHESIASTPEHELNNLINTASEQVWCSIKINDKKIYLCSYYRAPTSDENSINELYDALNLAVHGPNGNTFNSVILGGDFNFPGVDWENKSRIPDKITHSLFNTLFECINTYNLEQYVLNPTRVRGNTSSVLDLLFSNIDDLLVNCNIHPGVSDHDIVCADIALPINRNLEHSIRYIYQYKQANWQKINQAFEDHLHTFSNYCEQNSGSESGKYLNDFILKVLNENIPTKQAKTRNQSPYLNRDLKILLRKRRKAHSKAKRTNHVHDWETYRNLSHQVNIKFKENFNSFITKSLGEENSKPFWKYIKSKRQTTSIPPLRHESGELITGSYEKANLLNEKFKLSFVIEDNDRPTPEDISPANVMPDINFSIAGISKLLIGIKPSKSAGPDQIPGRFGWFYTNK